MIELKKALYQQINSAHVYHTYDNQAPETASFPYVVYKLLPIQNTEKDRDDYTLEVSCWDRVDGTSSARVTQLADDIRGALVNFRLLDIHNLIIASRPSVGYVPDPDEQIKRYDVTSTLMTYRR